MFTILPLFLLFLLFLLFDLLSMVFFNSGLTLLKVHRQVLPTVHCTVIELLAH